MSFPPRIETGPLEFENDWCGVFIRGDDALSFAYYLNLYLSGETQDPFVLTYVRNLQKLLSSCQQSSLNGEQQQLKPVEDCVR